jgi:hypothetical protein
MLEKKISSRSSCLATLNFLLMFSSPVLAQEAAEGSPNAGRCIPDCKLGG